MNAYDVVFATDENYVKYVSVALVSLLENNKDLSFRVNYLIDKISDVDRSRLECLADKYGCEIKFFSIASEIFNFSVTKYHFRQSVYFRLLMADLLGIEKALYLDADVVINGSIKELLSVDVNDSMLAAVPNPGFSRHENLGMSSKADYFNAGVMLVNLEKWRSYCISKKSIDYMKRNAVNIEFADQDVLNALVDGNWVKLHLKYNQQAVIFDDEFENLPKIFHDNELNEAKINPVIIHYSGSSKPWLLENSHPYKKLYWKYLKLTPFYSYFPDDLTYVRILKLLIPKKIKPFVKVVYKRWQT